MIETCPLTKTRTSKSLWIFTDDTKLSTCVTVYAHNDACVYRHCHSPLEWQMRKQTASVIMRLLRKNIEIGVINCRFRKNAMYSGWCGHTLVPHNSETRQSFVISLKWWHPNMKLIMLKWFLHLRLWLIFCLVLLDDSKSMKLPINTFNKMWIVAHVLMLFSRAQT